MGPVVKFVLAFNFLVLNIIESPSNIYMYIYEISLLICHFQ
uniref:Uncharacterized protein n=1 Tax=Rhizophora mucronata TaxID=61149 RepID=A0A2P2QTB2_RHIMU